MCCGPARSARGRVEARRRAAAAWRLRQAPAGDGPARSEYGLSEFSYRALGASSDLPRPLRQTPDEVLIKTRHMSDAASRVQQTGG